METAIVKQEEDWTYSFDGTEAELTVKTELDQDVDFQSACGSPVPTLFNDSPTIKQEPIHSCEEAVTSQENSLCTSPHNVCDATVVKVENHVTEAAVKENDEWLQQLTRAHREQKESLQDEMKDEFDKAEETTAANTAVRKYIVPVTVGSRKFVLVPSNTINDLAAVSNTHKQQARTQLPLITKFIMKVLKDKTSKIKPKLSLNLAQRPVAEPVTSSVKPVLRISNTEPVSKVLSTAKTCQQPQHIPQKTGSNIVKQYRSVPDCIFQPKTKNKTSDITKTNLISPMNNATQHSVTINGILDQYVAKNYMTPLIMTKKITPVVTNECLKVPVDLKSPMNNGIQRSVTINGILDQYVAKNFMTPLIMTKKITPVVTNECLNVPVVNNTSSLVRSGCSTSPVVRNSYTNSPLVQKSKDSTQAKEPKLTKESHKLLNILETLKASKRAEAFEKDTRVPVGINLGESPVANVKPIPQKTMENNPTSVSTKIKEILTLINSMPPQPIEAKAKLKPKRFINSIPTSQLEASLSPCFVKLDRLKILTCAVCRQQFYLKSQFVQHVLQHVRAPSIMSKVPCNICGKYYRRKYIKIHERKEHGPKKFWCDHCGKKCSDKASLIKHLTIHSDVKLYRCDVCKKRFRSKSNLLSHQQMHSTDKPYICLICDKQFRWKTGLKKHSLYHLAVRPHQCKICDKQFCQLFHLERHMLVHTGERPYACVICNMRFTRSSHRIRHMAKIHKSKYACEVCKKCFKERSRLEKHKRVHLVIR